MKKKYFKSIVLGLATVALASCSDVADEITSIVYNRNFSPTSVEAKVRNRTNIELSWNLGDGVTNYNVEVYANDSLTFAGSPVKSFSVSPDEVPVLIKGLEGETQYSFRVQATDGNSSRDSKWSSAYAKTEAEQIFKNVAEEDIKGSSVTLRWTAGEKAATIELTPGDIVYNVTDDDIAAGAATITGLTPETEYKALLKSATGKTRGTITFKTGIDLAETDILVKAGADIAAAIKDAPEGYRLVVEPGEYGIATDEAAFGGSITISKQLTIKGLRQNEHPVIKGRFKIEAPLTIDQCTRDGKGTDGGQCFDFTAEGEVESLTVTNSEVKNYTKGFFYINKAVLVNTITIDGNIISNIECDGGDLFDCRKGGYNKFDLKNNTMYVWTMHRVLSLLHLLSLSTTTLSLVHVTMPASVYSMYVSRATASTSPTISWLAVQVTSLTRRIPPSLLSATTSTSRPMDLLQVVPMPTPCLLTVKELSSILSSRMLLMATLLSATIT